MRRAVLLMGPTAAGKSALAIALARARPFEIVSVDSALVYQGMDIGTAKPDLATRAEIPHHLIDIRDPTESYSAGEFVLDAARLMDEIWSRGREPLLVGGTMLYFQALSAGIADLPQANAAVRATIDAEAKRVGWPELHRELSAIDPAAASRIHSNDAQRIQRALEVFKLTGEPISSVQLRRTSVLKGVRVVEFGVAPQERAVLNARIEARFTAMLEEGFVAEVERLRERNDLTAEHPAMRAVGYRQVWRYLAGQGDLREAIDLAIVATRQLAKRQFTWLRARTDLQWLDSANPGAISALLAALPESETHE
jgi:tRNA dimethylallyltransferase